MIIYQFHSLQWIFSPSLPPKVVLEWTCQQRPSPLESSCNYCLSTLLSVMCEGVNARVYDDLSS